jgi:hypothetical protein
MTLTTRQKLSTPGRALPLSVGWATFRTSVRITIGLSVAKEAHVASEIIPAGEVLIDGPTTPIEFTFRGKRFRIHAVLSRWCESGGWWNRVSDGKYRPDDQARALWRVEAAPIGALTTFQLERDETTGQWIVTTI